MHKLKIRPVQAGYSVQLGSNVQMQELDGGAPRYAVFTKKSSHTVNVQWIVNRTGYQYLVAFYSVWESNTSQPFLADLIIDGEEALQQYQCGFVPGSFQLNGKNGDIHTVSAQLKAKARKRNTRVDALLVAAGDANLNIINLFNPVAQVINHDLPDAFGNVGE